MNYINMKLTKMVDREYYEVECAGHPRFKEKAKAIDKACEVAVGKTKDIKVFKVSVTVWNTNDGLAEGRVREATWKELAVLVAARPVKGKGGWIDYEE